jgi:hypothetical protein
LKPQAEVSSLGLSGSSLARWGWSVKAVGIAWRSPDWLKFKKSGGTGRETRRGGVEFETMRARLGELKTEGWDQHVS